MDRYFSHLSYMHLIILFNFMKIKSTGQNPFSVSVW